MQRYWWPGYEIQLLEELQRQQHNAQFCDTLLQTEGISVPTHSCILAALSPYLSQRLSASRSPPLGQKRQLQLQAVKAQTLLKIVGLLYSGVLEVKGSIEQDDVLSAARQFGITDLVEGHKDWGMNEGELQEKRFESVREKDDKCKERTERRKMQDAQVQAEMVGRRATDCPSEKRSCVSTGTQTGKAGEKEAGSSFPHSSQTKPLSQEPASSVAESFNFSVTWQPQNFTLHKDIYSTCFPPSASIPSGVPSDGESTLDQSSDSITDPTSTSAWPSDVMNFPISLNDSSNQQSFESGDKTGTGIEDEQTNTKRRDNRENAEQSNHASRAETPGEGSENFTEKKHAHAKVGMKSLAKMKELMQTQISIKVKLRRRTKGEVWEVVSVQDTDERLSVLNSLKQADLTSSEPFSVQPGPVHKPETPILHPAPTDSAEPTAHLSAASDIQLLSSDCFSPNQNDDLESVPLSQPPSPIEESDEQMEKLLEDIMIGLNILPSLGRDRKKPNQLHPSHDEAPAINQAPVTESDRARSQMHAGISAAGCVCYPEFDHSSSDAAQDHPSCSSLSSVSSVSVAVQQQQLSPPYHSSVTSVWQRDETSNQDMSKSQRPYTQLSPRDDQSILEFVPLMNGYDADLSFSLPCKDDLWLPQCLSPLQPFGSGPKHGPVFTNSTNGCDVFQPRLKGRPWLAENPRSLQFPLSAVRQSDDKSASIPQETNHGCWSSQRREHLVLDPQARGARTESCYVKEVKEGGTVSTGHHDAAASKKRKRKCTSHPQDVAGALLAYKDVKISDGTKRQISLNVCSVSLSSNNVLAKQSKMASSYKWLGKRDGTRTATESWREKTGGAVDHSTDQTRIKTRGFLKKTKETHSKTSPDKSKIVNKQDVSLHKRKRGRPLKTKLQRGLSVVSEKSSQVEQHQQQMDNDLPNDEGETTRMSKKRKRNKREEELAPQKKNSGAESNSGAAHNDNSDPAAAEGGVVPTKRPPMVTLKEFKDLFKRRHSRARISQENQETNETARDEESKEKTCGSRCEELIKEAEMDLDVAQPRSRRGGEESHVTSGVTVDKNNNRPFNRSTAENSKAKRDDTNTSTAEETGLCGVKYHPVFSPDVSGEEGAKLAAEREQPVKRHNEAVTTCDTTQGTAMIDEGSSHSGTHTPPQKDKMPSGHSLNPQTPERPAPPLSDTAGLINSSVCAQEDDEEEEEEEEVEVDVLLYSPDKVSQSRECEDELDSMDVTPEEEEEEDVNEIDVTGDEAE